MSNDFLFVYFSLGEQSIVAASRVNVPESEDDYGANVSRWSSGDGLDIESLSAAYHNDNAGVEGFASYTSSPTAMSQSSHGSPSPSPLARRGLIARFIAACGADDPLSHLCQEYPWQELDPTASPADCSHSWRLGLLQVLQPLWAECHLSETKLFNVCCDIIMTGEVVQDSEQGNYTASKFMEGSLDACVSPSLFFFLLSSHHFPLLFSP